MAKIGFIGLGNMGLPMEENLIKMGHDVSGFDLSADACMRLAAGGGTHTSSIADACNGASVVIDGMWKAPNGPRASRYARSISATAAC